MNSKELLKESKWVAIMDLDEFLYSPKDINIKNILDKYDSYSQITVDWLCFGSNEHLLQPQSVVEGFTKRSEVDTSSKFYSYKSIFKSAVVLFDS